MCDPHEAENEMMDFWLEVQRLYKQAEPARRKKLREILAPHCNDKQMEELIDKVVEVFQP